MMFADIRVEWRVNDIERKLHDKAESYEVHSLRSNVDNLERTCRDFSSVVDELRNELQACQEELWNLKRNFDEHVQTPA